METCSACGNRSLFAERYGAVTLCKACAFKVMTPKWKNKEYKTNAEVEEQKKKILELAQKAGFFANAISGLEQYFDSLIIPGLVKIVDGRQEQDLVIFEDHCYIYTSDRFNFKEIEKEYLHIMSGKRGGGPLRDLDGVVNSRMATDLIDDVVGSLLPGGGIIKRSIVRAGKNAALNMLSGQPTGESSRTEKRTVVLNVRTGKRRVDYSEYDIIRFVEPVGEETVGFILFQNSDNIDFPDEDVLFFYSNSSSLKKEVSQAYDYIKQRVSAIQKNLQDEEKKKREEDDIRRKKLEMRSAVSGSLADELLKFKQLLDIGAITQDEFNAMKKQLMDI